MIDISAITNIRITPLHRLEIEKAGGGESDSLRLTGVEAESFVRLTEITVQTASASTHTVGYRVEASIVASQNNYESLLPNLDGFVNTDIYVAFGTGAQEWYVAKSLDIYCGRYLRMAYSIETVEARIRTLIKFTGVLPVPKLSMTLTHHDGSDYPIFSEL